MRTRWSLLLIALALLVAACGGDSDDSGDEESSPSTVAVESGDDSSEAAPETTAGQAEVSGDPNSEWCQLARQTQDQLDLAVTDPFALFTPDGMNQLTGLLDMAVQAAPPEIRSDVASTRDSFGQLRTLLESYDYDFFSIPETEFDGAFDETALDQASSNIEAYNQQVCGITPEGGDATTDTAPPADDGGDAPPPPASGEAVDLFVQSLTQSLGISEEQARCLADELDIATILSEGGDPSNVVAEGIFDVLSTCGISAADLAG
ncbi:MAG: hypothetical protein AAGA99_14560 [Actinomycetota bacterium]